MFDLSGISWSVILLILWMETILSADNAVVLADTAIQGIGESHPDRIKKVLRWGYIGAIILRVVVLFFATTLIHIWRLKCLAWLYLVWLAIAHFIPSSDHKKNHELWWVFLQIKQKRWLDMAIITKLILLDLMFAIDNLGTCVSLTNNFWNMAIAVMLAGVSFMMVAKYTVKLVETYPFMQTVAYSMIWLIGCKMIWSSLIGVIDSNSLVWWFAQLCDSHRSEQFIIWSSIVGFGIPLLTSWLWWRPTHRRIPVSHDPILH